MPSSRTVHKTPTKAKTPDALKPNKWSGSGPEPVADTRSTKGAGKKKKKKK